MKYNELPEEMQNKYVKGIPHLYIIISIIWIIVFSIISIVFLKKGHMWKYYSIIPGFFVLAGIIKLLQVLLNQKDMIEKEKHWLQEHCEFTNKEDK